jgi:hypothetical protein
MEIERPHFMVPIWNQNDPIFVNTWLHAPVRREEIAASRYLFFRHFLTGALEMLNPLGIFLSSLSRLLPRQLTRRSPLDVCPFSKRYADGMKHEIPHKMQSSWGRKNERVLVTHPCVRHWVRVVDVATDA